MDEDPGARPATASMSRAASPLCPPTAPPSTGTVDTGTCTPKHAS